jgi:hypothetical protein
MIERVIVAALDVIARPRALAAPAACALGVLVVGATFAQSNTAPVVIAERIDESRLVALRGTTGQEASAANDRGPISNDFLIEHLLLQLRRSPQQEESLGELIDQLHDPRSPNFHHWLTPEAFGRSFGLVHADLTAITDWLASHGLRVNVVYPNGTLVDFSGTAGQLAETFKAEIHYIDVAGTQYIANMHDLQVPQAVAPSVIGVVGMRSFAPRHKERLRAKFTVSVSKETYLVAPEDLAVIYNLNPLFSEGISGQGQTIAVLQYSDLFSPADWTTFRSTFGLSANYPSGSLTTIHPAPPSGPNNCLDPGVTSGSREAIGDVEWASASAPSAAIELVSCSPNNPPVANSVQAALLIALQNLINARTPPPEIVSLSINYCEAFLGQDLNAAYGAAYQQAVAEGVSIFVAASDLGGNSCDFLDNSSEIATHGASVNGYASTPYNVAVGGTDFADYYFREGSTYWNPTNTANYGSAMSYVPEIPWNDSCGSQLLANFLGFGTTYGSSGLCNNAAPGGFVPFNYAGSGGPSSCATGVPSIFAVTSGTCAGWPKPSWQSGVIGIPSDGVRDLPDVALFAGNGTWGHYYVLCDSDTSSGGNPCAGTPDLWSSFSGTSASTPVMAGIQALVNQKNGGRQGNPNYSYYKLAAQQYGAAGNANCNANLGNAVAASCIFYDVTQGDTDVPCTGFFNCYTPSGTIGVLSTSDTMYLAAYPALTGWDFATGLGSVNAYNLASSWPAAAAANYTGLFWHSPSGSESGWGINFEHQGNIIFATWFTYDLTGKAWWLSMTANQTARNTFSGTLYQTHGPAFDAVPFNPALVTATPVGKATLTFADVNDGTFAYTVNGVSQVKTITRQVFGPLATCVWGAQSNLALATNASGLWWAAPAGVQSGWGINFTQQGNIIFATWFTYNFDGKPLWLSVTANNTALGVYSGSLYLTRGPAFNAVPFLPVHVSEEQVGTAKFIFANGNSGTFSYTVDTTNGFVSQSKAITQQVFASPGTVCQ